MFWNVIQLERCQRDIGLIAAGEWLGLLLYGMEKDGPKKGLVWAVNETSLTGQLTPQVQHLQNKVEHDTASPPNSNNTD